MENIFCAEKGMKGMKELIVWLARLLYTTLAYTFLHQQSAALKYILAVFEKAENLLYKMVY